MYHTNVLKRRESLVTFRKVFHDLASAETCEIVTCIRRSFSRKGSFSSCSFSTNATPSREKFGNAWAQANCIDQFKNKTIKINVLLSRHKRGTPHFSRGHAKRIQDAYHLKSLYHSGSLMARGKGIYLLIYRPFAETSWPCKLWSATGLGLGDRWTRCIAKMYSYRKFVY